jgi:hypothetical protein
MKQRMRMSRGFLCCLQDGRSAAAALQQECLAGGDRCKLILNDGVQVINTDERGSKGLQASGVTLRSGKRSEPQMLPVNDGLNMISLVFSETIEPCAISGNPYLLRCCGDL